MLLDSLILFTEQVRIIIDTIFAFLAKLSLKLIRYLTFATVNPLITYIQAPIG